MFAVEIEIRGYVDNSFMKDFIKLGINLSMKKSTQSLILSILFTQTIYEDLGKFSVKYQQMRFHESKECNMKKIKILIRD